MHNTYSRKFILPEQQKIIDFLNSIEFTGYYKNNSISAIDQKCTFDILNVNAKCVLNFYNNKNKKEFKINDFFDDEYSRKIYEDKTSSNGKAILRNETSKEYDKIFGNILETLSYVEILFKNYKGNERIYSINDRNVDILKILASSEEACVAFICHFVWLLVKDDKEIITHLNNLKIDEYDNNIKDKFKESTINWLKKNSNRQKDAPQISQKINNPLFYLFEFKKYSSKKKYRDLPQSLKDLSYFRIHKRDINKKHGLTRNEQIEFSENKNSIFNNNWLEIKKKILAANLRYFSYLKHKKINEYHSELSLEILDNGNHIHHIWPKSYWNPEKENDWLNRNIYENLIILNQMEHLGKAHPKNKTKIIDKKCLNEILIAQYKKIRIFEKKHDPTYNIRKFYSLCCLIWKTKEELNVKNNDMNLEKIYLYIEDLIFL